MMMRRAIFFTLTSFSLLSIGLAQIDTVNMIKYSSDYRFTEGLYLNIEQVKSNSPFPKSRVLTTVDYNDKDFFEKVLREKKVSVYDKMGLRQDIETSKIWGYSSNGVLYIQISGEFNRISIIGSVCHFIGNVSTYQNRYRDPYYHNPYYNPYYYRHGMGPSNYESKELKQFLLDFHSGRVFEYNVNNVTILLMNDPELHDEFVSLRKRKQKQQMFMYIRKYNERNPLYLPEIK